MNIPTPATERFLNGELVPTHSARDIHAYLEVRTDFPTWIRKRIQKNQFTADKDYLITECRSVRAAGNLVRRLRMFNYHCSVPMAEQLITIETSDPYVLSAKRRPKGISSIERAQQAVEQLQLATVQIDKDKYIQLLENQIALLNRLVASLEDTARAAR